MENKMKMAIVGIGSWGKNLLKEFNLQAEVIYACHNGKTETSKFLKENYPTVKEVVLEEILSDTSIEAVAIATPTLTHKEIALKAINARKHVFLEKPGGSSSAELEEIVSQAKEKRVTLAIGYELPHHPAWKNILEIIPLNSIKKIHLEFFKWGTFVEHAVTNLLCHDISLLLDISPEVKVVRTSIYGIVSSSDVVDTEFDCGTFGATSWINRVSLEKKRSVTVVSDGTSLIWSNDKLFDTTGKEISINANSPVSLEIKDFIEAIRNKREPKINGDFALAVYKILDRIML